MNAHADEIASGQRFAFGENWSRFLSVLDEQSIEQAKTSLRSMLKVQTLKGKSFLDIGSGSGLFSLAARLLGAQVHSFDYDPQSVACTAELKRRYFEGDADWHVEQGSALDAEYLERLGQFDVVYSWGVLHHTGNMWRALELVAPRVKPDGTLFIALYNDQGWVSRYWLAVKRLYHGSLAGRILMIVGHAPYLLFGRIAVRALSGRLREARGMSLWYDMFDWLGGYPFEVVGPGQVLSFFDARGFKTRTVHAVGRRHGCNEYVFQRVPV